MTIDEAIAHAREVAKEKYTEGMLCHANPDDEKLGECIKCAREHEQIAELLEELKEYRQKPEGWMWDEAEQKGYNKAIDDIGEALLDEIYSQNIKMIIYGDGIDTLDTQIFPYKLWDNIAEQLKAGGTSGTN